jgi:A/G-specific adenine glycosylase
MNFSFLLNKKCEYFKQSIMSWHLRDNKRSMPWKGIKDVYKIWLSEIILQQTRVEQGMAYYEKFIENFPTIQDLAKAQEKSVIKLWEGLGYYNRCRNLHHTAKYIVQTYNGHFPDTYEGLLALKGVGPYTAAAIASFGYNIPKPVIDGNVIRVLSRYFGISTPVDSSNGKKMLSALAENCLDFNEPGAYNQAIMDFGATICKPASAKCTDCILNTHCKAYKSNRVDALPLISKKIVKKKRWFIIMIISCRQHYAIQIRQSGDVWAGLHSFPIKEQPSRKNWLEFLKNPEFINDEASYSEHEYCQQLTHQTIYARVLRKPIKKRSLFPEKAEWIHQRNLSAFAFPRLIRDVIIKEHLLSE